jgi:hypothetical protein
VNPQDFDPASTAMAEADTAFAAIKKGKPTIRLPGNNHYLSVFADELGSILASKGFYNFNSTCAKIELNPKLRCYEPVTISPQAFRTIIEAYCVPFALSKKDRDFVRFNKSLSVDHATATLASPNFLSKLPVLNALNSIPLPVRRADGQIELLPEGYDAISGIFTVKDSSYIPNLPFTQAKTFITHLLGEVCFQPQDKERGAAVVLAQMLTLFCTHLLPLDAVRPGFLFSANAEGCGKTTLALLAIIPRLGYAPAASAPTEEEEMRKEILAVALTACPVFFLDNVRHHLASESLERLMTSPTIQGRILGQSREITLPNALTVIITGNGATISPDLRRRLRQVELFLVESKPEDHIFRNPLEIQDIITHSPKIRSALWSLVSDWFQSGSPAPTRKLPSFSAWSDIVAAIVEHAGFRSPCLDPANLNYSGDRDSIDMQKLVDAMVPLKQYKFSELVDLAHDHELFGSLIDAENPLDNKAKISFGYFLRKNNGRKFRISKPTEQSPPAQSQICQFSIDGNSRPMRRYSLKLLQDSVSPT